MSSPALRAAALATLLVAGCAGDDDGLGPTSPTETDAAIDVTTEDAATPDDTADAGGEIVPFDAEPAEEGADAAADDGAMEAASDTEGVDSFVADTSAPDTMMPDALDAAKVCLPALTTSSKGACDATVQSWPDEGANHFEPGTALTYCTRPPSSGDHYNQWAAYRVYDKPVPYGYLVHSLEHGAVVVLYKCATGACPTVQSQIVAVINARPVDPLCVDPIKRRVIVAPDPTLDVEVGASAWGWTYRATCVNAASLGKFIDDHYAKTAEDFCGDGVVPP